MDLTLYPPGGHYRLGLNRLLGLDGAAGLPAPLLGFGLPSLWPKVTLAGSSGELEPRLPVPGQLIR